MFSITSLDSKKTVIYLITIVFTGLFFTLVNPIFVFADDLKSPTFEVQMSTINITGGDKSSTSYKLSDTVGQTFQGQFNSAGYVILAGFQYINTLIPFSFKISNLDLDFGHLIPDVPRILTNTLTVTTGSAFGYSVKAVEDHPLQVIGGTNTIPDTACDLATPCLPTDANVWSDASRYGFGYNVQGTDVDAVDFVNANYYRPFAVQNIDQPMTVMSRGNVATSSAATISYKIDVSGSQAAGTYQNSIQYIAIPSF